MRSSSRSTSPPPPWLGGGGFTVIVADAEFDCPVLDDVQLSVNVTLKGDATTTGSVIGALPLVISVVPAQPSPVPPPLAVQPVALVELHDRVVDWPDMIEVGEADRDTVSGG